MAKEESISHLAKQNRRLYQRVGSLEDKLRKSAREIDRLNKLLKDAKSDAEYYESLYTSQAPW